MKKAVVVVVVIFLLLIVAVRYLTADRWWKKVSTAKVTYGGRPSAGAQVYRSRDSHLLINLESDGDSMYVVSYFDKAGRWLVGYTPSTNWHFLPYYAVSENAPPRTVGLGGAKIEVEPELVVRENSVEFTSQEEVRVHVTW